MSNLNLEDSGFCPSTGIFRSKWGDSSTPTSPNISFPTFLLHNCPPPCPVKPAYIDAVSGEAISYSDFRALVGSVAKRLGVAGVNKGDVVLVVSPNSVHFPAIALGIMSIGAVFSTANFLLTRQEITSQVEDSHPVLILTIEDLLPKLDGLTTRPVLIIDDFLADLHSSQDHATNLSDNVIPYISQDDPAALMYSSGTTGKSKGVVSTHRNLIAMSSALRQVWHGEAEVYMCVVPLFHMFGFSVFVCGTVAAGATVVVLRKYSVVQALMAVEEHRVTRLPAVPPMVIQLTRSVQLARGYHLGSLKEVICSGAPIGKDQMEQFINCYPMITLSQCYGLTETTGPVTLCDGIKGRFHTSIGRLIPSVEAKIVDTHTGKALPPNKHGELCVRGPPIMQGYLENKEATSLAIDDEGWLHTGDLCFIDLGGLVYVVDRIKELIKYKAYQVAPAELEEILSKHPDIQDVAVISQADHEVGEIPVACVVRKAGSEVQEHDIITFTENKVAPYKKIRKVIFVEFIPRSPSGKILRRHLKASQMYDQKLKILSRL